MKIVMVSVYFLPTTVGGVELHIYHLSRAIQRLGHEVEIVHPVLDAQGKGMRLEREVINGVKVLRPIIPSRFAGLQKYLDGVRTDTKLGYLFGFLRKATYGLYARKVRAIIQGQLPTMDVVHQHDFSSSWNLTRLLKGTPCVLTNHTGEFLFIRRHRILRGTLKMILKHYRAIIGPSRELCDMGFNTDRVTYIPNGVDLQRFRPLDPAIRASVRQKLGFQADEVLIICPRRWAPTKGIKFLVEALPELKQLTNTHFRVLMVGSDYNEYPAYRQQLLDRIHELGIEQEVVLCGTATPDQMAEYFGISDIAVIPSVMEATSLAGLEAMGCGLPIVASDVGGLPEIVQEGVTGLLVPPEDPSALARAISNLVDHADIRRTMGQQGRIEAQERFSWDAIARQTVYIYEKLVKA